jgi:glycine cleavage system H protein
MAREDDLQYTTDHEWVELNGDAATVGITAYAAGQLGDVVFVELPSVGDEVTAGAVVGEIESTKSVGELIVPVSGTITEVNDDVTGSPELVNSDPLGAGWLIKVQVTDSPDLLDAAAYRALTADA